MDLCENDYVCMGAPYSTGTARATLFWWNTKCFKWNHKSPRSYCLPFDWGLSIPEITKDWSILCQGPVTCSEIGRLSCDFLGNSFCWGFLAHHAPSERRSTSCMQVFVRQMKGTKHPLQYRDSTIAAWHLQLFSDARTSKYQEFILRCVPPTTWCHSSSNFRTIPLPLNWKTAQHSVTGVFEVGCSCQKLFCK